ncbi:hypothetical protein I3679_003045 [Proteus mirabilis]|uniref:Uncharacterized protein n=1 Tax=Proteus mirabilis TaxID=584 RepID=A0ABD5LQQ4_PROMI
MKLSAVVNFMETSSFSRKMMSFLLILNSLFIIYSILLSRGVYLDWEIHGFADWLKSLGILKLLDIPKVMLASALILLSFFMYMGARIAWCVSLILLVTIVFRCRGLSPSWYSSLYFISISHCIGYQPACFSSS